MERLREGYWLLTAEARYAPMLAGCKFSVSNVAVYLRAGRNQAAAVAVDRRDGRPVGNLPLRLHITGQPDMRLLCDRLKPAVEEAFLRGFHGEQAKVQYETGPEVKDEMPKRRSADEDDPFSDEDNANASLPAEMAEAEDDLHARPDDRNCQEPFKLSLAGDLRAAESYAQGVAARRRWPDFQQDRPLRTGGDGIAAVAVDLGRREYRYTLDVQRMAEDLDAGPLSHVSLDYQEPSPDRGRTRAVVWLAQPIHRSGDSVDFAGLVRRIEGIRLAVPATAGRVFISVGNRHGPIWEGPCEVSPAGMFHGQFRIPLTTPLGPCWFTINGGRAEPDQPLVVEEFRIGTCRVGLSLPRQSYTGGERIEGRVNVAYFTGKPAEGAEAEVALELEGCPPLTVAGLAGPDGGYRFSLPLPSFSSNKHGVVRATVMDISGQSYTQCAYVMCMADAFQVRVSPSERFCARARPCNLRWKRPPGPASRWPGRPPASSAGVRQRSPTARAKPRCLGQSRANASTRFRRS